MNKYPVLYQRELDDLPDDRLRVTSLQVDLAKNQYVLVRLGCYFEGNPDGLMKEFAFPIPASAQLSRLLERAVEEHLYGCPVDGRIQGDQD